jgi:penicillin-binding protein 1A
MRKIVVRVLWTLLAVAVLGAVVGFTAISEGWIGYMPPIEELQNPINRFATQIYSADGKIMGTWNYNRENRIMVDYTQLSPALVKALVATEDVRFYEHSGIDFYALGRAIVKRGLLGQKSAGGGSTITQQLAKQLYSETAHSVMERLLQKPIEWVIAVKLERNYTKDEIIAMYLNYFDFLHNAVGIKTASNTYFSKDPQDLTVTEAAVLVGLCKNPSLFNPVRHPKRSLERRNVVLSQMEKAGYLSEAQRDSLSAQPLGLKFHVADHKDGIAQYFRDFLRRYMMAQRPNKSDYPAWSMVKYHIDSINWETDPLYGWCYKNRKKDGEPYNVYTDGLKVYTTIDSRMQEYAEKAVYEHVAKYLQPAFTKEKKGRKTAPFSGSLSMDQVNSILMRSIRQCDRYRAMKASGASEEQIMQSFRTKTEMTVCSDRGDIDTVMTPLDSIL